MTVATTTTLRSNKMGIRTGVVSLLLGKLVEKKTRKPRLIVTGLMVEPAMGRYIFEDFHLLPSYIKAHGVIMGLVFCVMMPLGVIAIGLLNVRGSIWIHAGWQLISWCLMIAGFGLGVRIARITDNVSRPYNSYLYSFLYSWIISLTNESRLTTTPTPKLARSSWPCCWCNRSLA